jgi:tRNA pseudouridine32 synthase/23S rRNA pseudouridine746 synthase
VDIGIVFEDEWLMVINKPTGLLSVPGKDNPVSVYSLMRERRPDAVGPLIVHRLDMDTSGLMIIAKTKEAHEILQKMFATREIEKCYVALLDGVVDNDEGEISLPLCLNPEDRPRRIVNYQYGKQAITRYKVLERTADFTRVVFYPLTGRTHQLRVHAAHKKGLDAPIRGDRLYGQPTDRLYLHAQSLRFVHPVTGREIIVEEIADFNI